MIYITGDTHGEKARFYEFDKFLKKDDYIIICGDAALVWNNDYTEKIFLDNLEARPYTICYVDGNHENFDALYSYPKETWCMGRIHRIRKNIIHLCRGEIFSIEGKSFFAFGGAYSIDKYMRREGISWWRQEMPTDEEFQNANFNLSRHNHKVDYIITHTAPLGTLECLGINHGLKEYPINNYLEYVAENVTYKHWYMGHLHLDKDTYRNQSVLWFDVRSIQ